MLTCGCPENKEKGFGGKEHLLKFLAQKLYTAYVCLVLLTLTLYHTIPTFNDPEKETF